MTITRFSLSHSAFIVLIICLLSASALRAQTFAGRQKLTGSPPPQLEATVYPVSNAPSTINVIFNNPTGGQVRVVVRDEHGRVFYSEYESTDRYRRHLNVSYLPAGQYTVELSKRNERYTQAFVIESPTGNYVTMGRPTAHKTPELPVDKKLIVSQ